MRRSTILLAAGLLAGTMAGGAIGVAVGASTVPTIKACVESDGTMRYTSTGSCHSGEKKLSWNITGPRGATGPQGPAGGSSTPNPVAIYVADGPGISFGPQAITVASIRVPAGGYIAELYGPFTGIASGSCVITDNEAADPSANPSAIARGFVSAQGLGAYLDIAGFVQFTGPTTVYGRCSMSGETPGMHLSLTAVRRLPGLPQ